MLEAGYRNQWTDGAAGRSVLQVFPLALLRIGIGSANEIVVLPPSAANRSGAILGGVFAPQSGSEDAGVGLKRMLHDRAWYQDSAGFFYTAPTGTQGPIVFSAGTPTYTLTYTSSFPIGSRVAISATQNATLVPQFFSYQPSLAVSFALNGKTTLILSDQITTPLSSAGGTGNRALAAVQYVVSPRALVDAEYEINALPSALAVRQRAIGIGGAWLF